MLERIFFFAIFHTSESASRLSIYPLKRADFLGTPGKTLAHICFCLICLDIFIDKARKNNPVTFEMSLDKYCYDNHSVCPKVVLNTMKVVTNHHEATAESSLMNQVEYIFLSS